MAFTKVAGTVLASLIVMAAVGFTVAKRSRRLSKEAGGVVAIVGEPT